MTLPILITSGAYFASVTDTAATIADDLVATNNPGVSIYALAASTDLWFAQGDAPTATAGAGSTFLPAGAIVCLDGSNGAALSVIRDSADGSASLTPVQISR